MWTFFLFCTNQISTGGGGEREGVDVFLFCTSDISTIGREKGCGRYEISTGGREGTFSVLHKILMKLVREGGRGRSPVLHKWD